MSSLERFAVGYTSRGFYRYSLEKKNKGGDLNTNGWKKRFSFLVFSKKQPNTDRIIVGYNKWPRWRVAMEKRKRGKLDWNGWTPFYEFYAPKCN